MLKALVSALVLLPALAAAQIVTVTPPSGAPTTIDCSVLPGCTIAVTPALPPPPPPVPPTGTALWRLSCTAENFPACGVGYWGRETSPGVYQGHRVTRVGNGARFTLTPSTTQQQFYLGWQPIVPLLPDGTSPTVVWLRFRLTVHAPFNATAVGPNGPGSETWTDKLVIVNNGGSTRAIGELRPVRTSTDVTIAIQKGIEGGVTLTPRQDLQIGRTYAVQMRIARGSAVRFATCLDAATEAACVQSGTFSFNVDRFTNIGLGFYSNAAVSASGAVDFTIENAEIGTAFDPAFR